MLNLETKIPPPIVVLVTVAAMWLLSLTLPRVQVAASSRTATAIVIVVIGVAFTAAGVVSFRRAKTTISPVRPGNASSLVTSGVYRITRNPMYVGLLLVLVAWAVFLASPIALAGPVAFVFYMARFQIQPEERALSALFGSSYAAYKVRVRRWL